MTTFTEGNHQGEYLLRDEGYLSRDTVTVTQTGVALASGTVLGQVTLGTATSAAKSGNTGNGTMGAVTVGAGALPGVYTLTIVEPGTNVGTFTLENPRGEPLKTGVVATAYSDGGLGFTLADGSTDFASGDQFLITVAAGSGKYKARADAATDGSAVAAAVLYTELPAQTGDFKAVATTRIAEVSSAKLVGSNAAAVIALATKHIIVR
jgi:hypothetical protein